MRETTDASARRLRCIWCLVENKRMLSGQQVLLLVVIAHNLINQNECMFMRCVFLMYDTHNDVNLVVNLV